MFHFSLDHREKGGYTQNLEKFYPASESGDETSSGFEVIVYRGAKDDAQYAGPASLEEMAHTICYSEGPSGLNKDYLYNLATSLRQIQVHDDHVFELEKAVRLLETNKTS